MTDVFISYKKEDAQRIEPIARALANAGYDVWWDHRIPAGRSYRDVIGAALQTAKCVIVVWSKLSASAQWVLDEADEGKRRNVLLPLLIDDVEIPYGFRQIEAARLVSWTGDPADSEWQNALSAVAHFVGRAPGGPPKPLSAPSAPTAARTAAPVRDGARSQQRGLPMAALLGLAALVLIGGSYFAWQSGVFTAGPASTQTEVAENAAELAPTPPSDAATRAETSRENPTQPATPSQTAQTAPTADAPPTPRGSGTTEGVTRLVLSQGPYLVREAVGTWVEVDQSTNRSGQRWSESQRTADTIELRDPSRDAGMRIALREGWVYLYFPDWGEFRRQWPISEVERGSTPTQSFACYWLSNDARPTWRPMSNIATREQCFAQDSCNGGQGGSNGGCYKWAAGPDEPRQPWP